MTLTLPIITARDRLTSLPEELAQNTDTVAVTRHGEPVLAILSWQLYESIVETLEILGDRELMMQLRRSISEAEAGQTIPWENLKQELAS